jgi:hypothetical protein
MTLDHRGLLGAAAEERPAPVGQPEAKLMSGTARCGGPLSE